ncbi:MAG: MFS transporter [Planctomycetes bacterium]|nr:MFS transporter [Planctomycetota bacterium]
MSERPPDSTPKSPLREIVQPFIDIVHAPRALWGVNVGYFLEGFVYFGMLTYLAMYFNDCVGLNDVVAGRMVGVLTAGITVAMFFFGGLADRWGARVALLTAFCLLLAGRIVLSSAPMVSPDRTGLWSPVHLVSMLGILVIVLGYGLYQPAAYAAVRQFTSEKTAGMGYAMLYAVMNLGGWLPTFFSPIRKRYGITGAFWVYTALTLLGLLSTLVILRRKAVERAIADFAPVPPDVVGPDGRIAGNLECRNCGYNLRTLETTADCPECSAPVAESMRAPVVRPEATAPGREPFDFWKWITKHPLADAKFAFFIFCLIPVQTLFAHNWLTLPMYVARVYRDSWIGDRFEFASNFNPLLIFVLVPIVAALTQKARVYQMMVIGTAVMAAPTFLLALGPSAWALFGYLVVMTIGEAMWQPRFLQYAAEIAPEGRTGAYIGVAQFPWFLTKIIVSLYSGWFLERYCPKEGPLHTEQMWFFYGVIAIVSPVLLLLARDWVGKDFKTKAA